MVMNMIDHSECKRKIGINILKYRRLKNLTQEQLAERVTAAGISRNYMQRIECGGSCSTDMLMDIAQALEVPLYKLFVFDDD